MDRGICAKGRGNFVSNYYFQRHTSTHPKAKVELIIDCELKRRETSSLDVSAIDWTAPIIGYSHQLATNQPPVDAMPG